MKKLIQITVIAAVFPALSYAQNANSNDALYSGMCIGDRAVMENVYQMQQSGVPFESATSTFNSERDVRVRVFMKKVARQMYTNPKGWNGYVKSGSFEADCIKARKGY